MAGFRRKTNYGAWNIPRWSGRRDGADGVVGEVAGALLRPRLLAGLRGADGTPLRDGFVDFVQVKQKEEF